MSYLINFSVIIVLVILQSTIAREVTLFQGSVDLVLVWLAAWSLTARDHSAWFGALLAFGLLGYISALPWYVYMMTYLVVLLSSRFIHAKLWQSPLISMFVITIISSLFLYVASFFVMRFSGGNYQWNSTLTNVILPSVSLNILIAAPVYAIVRDMMGWVRKDEIVE
jgi:hypothetical protein